MKERNCDRPNQTAWWHARADRSTSEFYKNPSML